MHDMQYTYLYTFKIVKISKYISLMVVNLVSWVTGVIIHMVILVSPNQSYSLYA